MKRSPLRARAPWTYARTHAPTRDHALCTPMSSNSCVAGNADARKYIVFVPHANSRNAHHRRPSALDCRSRERQTERWSRWRRRRVPSGSRGSHLSSRSRSHVVPSNRRTCLPALALTYSSTSPCVLSAFFSSLSVTCHLPVASLRAHSPSATTRAVRLPSGDPQADVHGTC